MDETAIRARGLNYFRRTVALLYREIGVLKPFNHPGVAVKAKFSEPFFADRKVQAKQLYKLSITDPTVELTLARYEKRLDSPSQILNRHSKRVIGATLPAPAVRSGLLLHQLLSNLATLFVKRCGRRLIG